MNLQRLEVGVYGVNCYIISCEKTLKTAVIDPGGDSNLILEYLKNNNLELSIILLTHGHGDHIGGIPGITDTLNTPIYIHELDNSMLQDKIKNLSQLIGGNSIELNGDFLLKDGDSIELGELNINIIHTPGHTPGSISIKINDLIFTGDTLFANSIGRTDFEGGSFPQIIDSIKNKLLIYEDHVKVLPGHGPTSTIGKERNTNPFLIR